MYWSAYTMLPHAPPHPPPPQKKKKKEKKKERELGYEVSFEDGSFQLKIINLVELLGT
jgi:hypothetical protein